MRNAQLARTLALRSQSNQQVDPAVHNATQARLRAAQSRREAKRMGELINEMFEYCADRDLAASWEYLDNTIKKM